MRQIKIVQRLPCSSSWGSYLKPVAALPFLVSIVYIGPCATVGGLRLPSIACCEYVATIEIRRRNDESPVGLTPVHNSLFLFL